MSLSRWCLFLAAIAILLLRPYNLARNNFIDVVDDQNYMAHATSVVYGQFPDYANEYVTSNPYNHAVGSAILAVPFVFAFSLIDRAVDHPVTVRRTRNTVTTSWTGFGFAFASQFYFLLGVLLMDRTCRRMGGARPAMCAALSVAAGGLPLFAYRRAVFSHAYEYAAIAAGLYLLAAAGDPWARRSRRLYWSAIAGTAMTIFLIRYNNLPYASVLIAAALIRTGAFSFDRPTAGSVARAMILSVGLPLAFAWGYHDLVSARTGDLGSLWNRGVVVARFSDIETIGHFASRCLHVLFGVDWGLVFTAPLILLGLFGCWRWGSAHRFLLLYLLAASANFILVVGWGNQGDTYGYRYFVHSALPAATVGLSFWMRSGPGTERKRVWVTAALSVLPIIAMLVYEWGNRLTVTMRPVGWRQDWLHPTYMIEVLRTIANPKELLQTMFIPGLGSVVSAYLKKVLLGHDPIYAPSVYAKWAVSAAMPFAFAATHVLIRRQAVNREAPRGR